MKAYLGVLALWAGIAAAESGLDGWLRYALLPEEVHQSITSFPTAITALNSTETSPVYVAGRELQAGIQGVLNRTLAVTYDDGDLSSNASSSIVVGTASAYVALGGQADVSSLIADGFFIRASEQGVLILGQNERGALYGAFEYLSRLAQGNVSPFETLSNPDAPIRWVNQWDNLDGSIERGYAGPSIFFANNGVVGDLTRVAQYARLLASVRVNAVVVNNVNANPSLLNNQNIEGLGRIADAMRPYGVQLGISLNFASPQMAGGLPTFDPLDPSVIRWWNDKTALLYRRIPDMAGYLVKANSEGQPGPMTYGRTLAEGANLFARAVQPYGGIVMFRAFVYNHHLDWTVWTNDRANHAVEFFKDLDGQFLDNVVVQIKYGPIDFQVREPASPLFANIPQTNMAIELQITQEYLGQQSHFVYIPPLWKTILDFDMRVDSKPSLVRDIVSGKRFGKKLGGYAGVVNVGTDVNWLGHHLSMSNLYAYGLLAWDPTQDPEDLVRDWTRLTWGLDPIVLETVTGIAMDTWPTYENYTGNLGVQTLTDILYTHYGPNPASQDNNGWGQWTRAGPTHIGMDRTVANGTGNAGQYPPEVAAVYENIETTPDELLLWFHHVPYEHRLKSTGKTVIQHFYDAHYDGAATAQTFPARWAAGVRGRVDAERLEAVLFRLRYQAGHAIVWRDTVCNFYHRMSRGIPDQHGRVGPRQRYRIEAEGMELRGAYAPVRPDLLEASSGDMVVAVRADAGPRGRGEAVTRLREYPAGRYDVAVGYFDIEGGRARYSAYLNDELLVEWTGDLEDRLGHDFSTKLDGHSATRVTVSGVQLQSGDVIKVVGESDGPDRAAFDYVAVLPEGVVN